MGVAGKPRRLSRSESKDLTRRRLLDAARAVFLRHGFHAASVDMVAEEAGFTKGAVYSAFASKAELFLALYEERAVQRAAQAASAALAGVGAQEESVGAWAQVLRRERPWLLVLLEFWIFAARDPELRKRFAAIHGRYRTEVARAVEASAAAAGRTLPADAELITLCQLALGNGFALESVRDPALPVSDVYEQAARALARGFAALRDDEPARRRGGMR
jgi:AcrR family transcriptional regulator